jgi:glycosyltransferase involved in cell wall biosynthesis
MIKLLTLFPLHCNTFGVSHTFWEVCQPWQTSTITTQLLVPSCTPECRKSYVTEAIPSPLQRFFYRFPQAPKRCAEKYFLKHFHSYDAAYLWPGVSLKVTQAVKASRKPIFLERFNCFQEKAKRILDEQYDKLGVAPQHPITPQSIDHERSEVKLADYIFCPSPEVKQSFLEIGIPEQRLISSSYGWSPARFKDLPISRNASEPFTVLFVGSISVRKGAHVLLRSWQKAEVSGKLILCGTIEAAIAQSCADILVRSDVQHIPFTSDLSGIYAQASLFAFPSFEEGAPLVTYEAMAHSLAILTSPMGSAGAVRDGIDGVILSPYEEEAWVEALRTFAQNPDRCQRFGISAQQQAQSYTWDKVSARRAIQIIERIA